MTTTFSFINTTNTTKTVSSRRAPTVARIPIDWNEELPIFFNGEIPRCKHRERGLVCVNRPSYIYNTGNNFVSTDEGIDAPTYLCDRHYKVTRAPLVSVDIQAFKGGYVVSIKNNNPLNGKLARQNRIRLHQRACNLLAAEIEEFANLKRRKEIQRIAKFQEARERAAARARERVAERALRERASAREREPDRIMIDCTPLPESELHESNHHSEYRFKCSICFLDHEHKFIFACGHGPICEACIRHMASDARGLMCHLCRKPVQEVIPLFLSLIR